MDTYFVTSLLANSSLKTLTPPTQVILAPVVAWKPVTKPMLPPAHNPSPPFSAASAMLGAPESSDESVAKLSTGARKIGTKKGLLPSECEMPEYQTGAFVDERMVFEADISTGKMEAGVSRSGK